MLYQAEGKWAISTAACTSLLCGGAWPGGRAEPGPWQELSGLSLQSQALAKATHTKLRLGGSSSQGHLPKSRSPEKGWFCSSDKPVKQQLFLLKQKVKVQERVWGDCLVLVSLPAFTIPNLARTGI